MLVITYLLLLRAFRSVVLPLKAVLMNLLSISATYGVLVLVFQHGLALESLGLHSTRPDRSAGSRSSCSRCCSGSRWTTRSSCSPACARSGTAATTTSDAVAYGLEHTGRIITAAALIMIAAFSGFMAGTFVGLQEFGIGLSVAILLDATIVRAMLVPGADEAARATGTGTCRSGSSGFSSALARTRPRRGPSRP